MRIKLTLERNPQSVKFTDSLNAAIVAGLVEAGASSELLVGRGARPWTFGFEGRSDRNAVMKIYSLTMSTPDAELGEAMSRLTPDMVRVASSNGDTAYFGHAKKTEIDTSGAQVEELMVSFASPIAIPVLKSERSATKFVGDLNGVDLDMALRRGLERRAGRALDVRFHVDPLSMLTDVKKRIVSLRRAGPNVMRIPAFTVPMTLRGRPEDVEFAFLAGLGAKTHAGFGCPIFMK